MNVLVAEKKIETVNQISTDVNISKPILKWVGGKTQILDKLIVNYPKHINNYHEIFLGGGSVLLMLLSYVKKNIITITGNVYAYDLNEPLIYMYKNIQSDYLGLCNKIQELIVEFNACSNNNENDNNENDSDIKIKNKRKKILTLEDAKKSKENYYYWTRDKYNNLTAEEKKTLLGSALFIFLNKTCFRGVFRTGPNGFNVPYGHYNNPEIINNEHVKEIHDLIENVIFSCSDFSNSLTNIKDGDFVYLDPPYAPEKSTSFVGYTKDGFNINQHNTLFQLCDNLTNENKKLIMSNSDVQLVRNHFNNEKYKTNTISCKRSINAKNPDAKTNEVIVKNY
jgi:DNA adenine methylase